MSPNEHSRLWKPVISLNHLKKNEIVDVGQIQHFSLTNVQDFRIYTSLVSSTTINCPMDFTNFPFDKHICMFKVIFHKCFLHLLSHRLFSLYVQILKFIIYPITTTQYFTVSRQQPMFHMKKLS